MTTKDKLASLKTFLDDKFPVTECFLNHSCDYELLFAVIMSAQAQDKVVNMVNETLFKTYPTLEAIAHADVNDVQHIIARVGIAKNKARNIIATAKILLDKYDGKVPSTREELVALPGVGNKTASVILGELYNENVFPVDTHVKRVMTRLGIAKENMTPDEIELQLEKLYRLDNTIHFHRQVILFGRQICIANNQRKCSECPLPWCKYRLTNI